MSTKLHVHVCRRDDFWWIRDVAYEGFRDASIVVRFKDAGRKFIAAEGPTTAEFIDKAGKILSKWFMAGKFEKEQETTEFQVIELDEEHLVIRVLTRYRWLFDRIIEERELPVFTVSFFTNTDYTEEEDTWFRGWADWVDSELRGRRYMVCPVFDDLHITHELLDQEWIDMVHCARRGLLYREKDESDAGCLFGGNAPDTPTGSDPASGSPLPEDVERVDLER